MPLVSECVYYNVVRASIRRESDCAACAASFSRCCRAIREFHISKSNLVSILCCGCGRRHTHQDKITRARECCAADASPRISCSHLLKLEAARERERRDVMTEKIQTAAPAKGHKPSFAILDPLPSAEKINNSPLPSLTEIDLKNWLK